MKTAYPVGTKVRSHYRASWTGTVVASGRDLILNSGWFTRQGVLVDPVLVPGKGYKHPDGHTPIHRLPHTGCVLVQVTHDRKGLPIRKAKYRTIDCHWLEELGV